MEEEFGTIGLSREQFRELILHYIIGMHVRRQVSSLRGDDLSVLENLERQLLSFAPGFEAEDLVERAEDSLYPSRKLEDLCHDLIETRDDAEFWERLEDEFATRDFLAALPPEQRLAATAAGLEASPALYKKYRQEFDVYGIDRMTVDESKEALD